jgi:hypothetical protein
MNNPPPQSSITFSPSSSFNILPIRNNPAINSSISSTTSNQPIQIGINFQSASPQTPILRIQSPLPNEIYPPPPFPPSSNIPNPLARVTNATSIFDNSQFPRGLSPTAREC